MFVAVVEKKGIRNASEELGKPKSSVSRGMTQLETHLGARLMERSTRSSRITDAGLEYYRDCRQILEEVAQANHALQRKLKEFCGQVRLSAPTRLGTDLFQDLAIEFARCHPDASLVLEFHDRSVNLIEERYDLAVSLGPAGADSSVVSRRIGTLSSSLYASRSYLLRHGAPQHPDALRDHRLLAFGKSSQAIVWQFKNKEQTVSIHANPHLQCTDDELLIKWSASDLGICLVPDCMARKEHSALVPVLPDWPHLSTEVRVSFVSHRSVTPLMRSVLDMLARLAPARTEVEPSSADCRNFA